MGKSTTPTYALELDGYTMMAWRVRKQFGIPGNGAPTAENLARYVQVHIDSLKAGGVNAHISKALGHIPVPQWARIVRNDGSRTVIAEWKAPAFLVI